MNWYKNSKDIHIAIDSTIPETLFAANIISNKINNYKLRIAIYNLDHLVEEHLYYNISYDQATTLAEHHLHITNNTYNTIHT